MIFDKLKAWRRRKYEEQWTREVFEGLRVYIGDEKAKEIFRFKTLKEKTAFLEKVRDETKRSDIIIPKPKEN